jgi:hypothetical protein
VLGVLRAFKEAMSKNSAGRVWRPAVLWGCLSVQSVQRDVADILLTASGGACGGLSPSGGHPEPYTALGRLDSPL